MKGTRAFGAAAVGLALLVSGGCGDSDSASDKITEELLEQAGGGDVDIERDGEKMTFEGPDGEKTTYETDADGNVKVTGKDGSVSSIGDGTELPDDWPADLEMPEGTELVAAMSDGTSMSATGNVDGDTKALYEDFKSMLEDAGYEITDDYYTASDTGDFGTIGGAGDHRVTISVAGTGDGDQQSVSITISEATEAE